MENDNSTTFYEISTKDEIAIIRIKEKVFDLITDINQSAKLLDFLSDIDHSQEIKVLLFYNDPESFSINNYDKFIKRVMGDKDAENETGSSKISQRNIRFREINILNSLIKQIAGLQIIVVSGIQGEVVTPFAGASLVSDFRFASEDAEYCMIHNKYGLHPSGALPFFLSSFVHHSKALELQLREIIPAKEALELGLINKIMPKKDFEKNLLAEVKKFTHHKYCTIRNTKRLTNFYRKALSDYFEYESGLLNL